MPIFMQPKLDRNNRHGHIDLAVIAVLAIVGFASTALGLAGQQSAPEPSLPAATKITSASQLTQARHLMITSSRAPALSHKVAPPTMQASGPVLGYALPLSLNIPAIGVNSTLYQVGLNNDGTIAVPKPPHFDNPAWYQYSPAPGQYGASVIVGHVDNYKTGPSVFYNLGKLLPGNTVSVVRSDHKTALFQVTVVRQYLKVDFPTLATYTSQNNDAELRLITCSGVFNHTTGHYESNTIAFAKLVGVR